MSDIGGSPSGDSLKSTEWFHPLPERRSRASSVALRLVVGGLIVGLLVWADKPRLAVTAAAILAVVTAVTLGSRRAESWLSDRLGRFGNWAGRALGAALLIPLYLAGFSVARAIRRALRRDPLRLRGGDDELSYWLPVDTAGRRRRWLGTSFATERLSDRRQLVAWAACALLLAAGVELGLRGFGFGTPVLYRVDARIGYRPAPDRTVRRYGGTVQTNSYGMRAPTVTAQVEGGALRILMLGDSTLWGGSYLDQPDLYPRRLEDALNLAGVEPVEVLNMAANGWGPFHKAAWIESFGLLGADLVVVCMSPVDLARPHTRLERFPYFTVDAPPRLALEEVAVHTLWRLRMRRMRVPEDERRRQQELGSAEYLRLARLVRERGRPVRFEILPTRAAAFGDAGERERQALRPLTEALESSGVEVGYPDELFRRQGDSDLYRDDIHLSKAGHRLYADYLETRLRVSGVGGSDRPLARTARVAAQ